MERSTVLQKEYPTMTTESSPLVVRIANARRQVQLLSKEFREKTGYTATQAAILCELLGKEGVSQTTLVRTTGIDRSTLSDTIRRLLKQGLLSRRRTREDARAYAVKLTASGKEIADKLCKTM